jgi:FkbM family methyltransferase
MKLLFKFLKEKFLLERSYVRSLKELTGLSFSDLLKLKYSDTTIRTKFLGSDIEITDNFWHLHSLNEIFIEGTYEFKALSNSPLIIDCGANIGLSSIFFKKLYPYARILAYEADSDIFRMMLSNFKAVGLNDVIAENKAVWVTDGILDFNASGSLGGSIVTSDKKPSNAISIPSISLRNLLQRLPIVDFLKIDIEGAEVPILNDCRDQLSKVSNIFVEYHRLNKADDKVGRVISIIEDAGFRVYVKEAWNNLPKPYLYKHYNPYFDLQLNIFGYKIS